MDGLVSEEVPTVDWLLESPFPGGFKALAAGERYDQSPGGAKGDDMDIIICEDDDDAGLKLVDRDMWLAGSVNGQLIPLRIAKTL
jgi:hypothetical protein